VNYGDTLGGIYTLGKTCALKENSYNEAPKTQRL